MSALAACGPAAASPAKPQSAKPQTAGGAVQPAAPEAADRPFADVAASALAEVRAARDASDPDRVRAALASALDRLRRTPGDLGAEGASGAIGLGTESLREGQARAAVEFLRRGVDELALHRPPDDLEVLRARLNLGTALRVVGGLVEARSLQSSSLELVERAHPGELALIQNARRTLAQTCGELGDAGAEIELRLSIDAALADRPRADPERLAAALELASVLAVSDREAEARARLAEVVGSLGEAGGTNGFLVARAEAVRGLLDLRAGEPASAALAFERALAAADPGDADLRVRARSNLGVARLQLGDPEGAREVLDEVLRSEIATYGPDHPLAQHARVNLIEPCRALGDLRRALALSSEALAGLERALPDDHAVLRAARLNRALVVRDLGDLPQARALLEHEVDLGDPSSRAGLDARHALGLVLDGLGERERGAAMLESVAAARHAASDPIAEALAASSVAAVVRDVDPARARDLEASALATLRERLPPTHRLVLGLSNNLAVTQLDLGEGDAAHETLLRVLRERERSLPDGHPDILVSIRNLAWSHARRGRIAEARATALDLANRLEAAARTWSAWLAPREVDERIAAAADDVATVLSLALPVRGSGADAALERRAFEVVEALRLVTDRSVRAAAPGADRRELRAATADLARAAAAGASTSELESARRRLDALQRQAAASLPEEETSVRVAALAARLGPTRALATFRPYTRCLPREDGSLSESECLCAFVLRGDGKLSRAELGPVADVERAVEAWRTALLAPRDRGLAAAADAGEVERGLALRALVLEPLLPCLAGCTEVALVPDGVLHLVPFDALPLDADGARAGDERGYAVLSSVRGLDAVQGGLGADALLAVGALDFDAGVDPAFAPARGAWDPAFPTLPATPAEIAAVLEYHERAFGADAQRAVLRGDAATRDAVATRIPGAAYLHFATHGWFAPDSVPTGGPRSVLDAGAGVLASDARETVRRASPLLLCGLALSGANAIADGLRPPPGRVSGEEVAAWDLARCELAVLSACETGLGVRRAGLGIASLRTAFHRGGARRVVTSLWRVPDEATRDLMLDFYRRVWIREEPVRSALWNAKLELRQARDEAGRPLHTTRDWAAWILSGPLG